MCLYLYIYIYIYIAAHIKFKALMFAYRTTSDSAPLYLNSLLQTYIPSRNLRCVCVCVGVLFGSHWHLDEGNFFLLNSILGSEMTMSSARRLIKIN